MYEQISGNTLYLMFYAGVMVLILQAHDSSLTSHGDSPRVSPEGKVYECMCTSVRFAIFLVEK